MVVLEVFTKTIEIRYKSTLLSKAAIVKFVTVVISLVVPFILAHISGGFWLKHIHYHEQPKVSLEGSYLFIAYKDNHTDPIIVCSNIYFYEKWFRGYDSCHMIKLREVKRYYDGKVDRIDVQVQIHLNKDKLTGLYFVLPIMFKLGECPIDISTSIIYQHEFHTPATELYINADLQLYQRYPIQCDGTRGPIFYSHNLIKDSRNIKDFELESILEEYLSRNVTTHLTNIYTATKKENTEKFNLRLSVRYPEVTIYYAPGFWHVLKVAWLQYFSIYVIISWVMTKIKGYIFNNKLVLYYEETPLKKHV